MIEFSKRKFKSRGNYEKRWFVTKRINPFDFRNSKEFNESTKKNISVPTFFAYQRIWKALGIKYGKEMFPIPPPKKKTKPKKEKVKQVKPKKVKVEETKPIKIKPSSQYIFNKISIKSKKKKELILEVLRITEPNFKKDKLLITNYLNFKKPISMLYFKELIPKDAIVTLNFPKAIEKSIQTINGKMEQTWKIIPEISKKSFNFGYVCSAKNVLNEFPIEILIPEINVTTSKESEDEAEKQAFFLPELHKYIQKLDK